MTKSTLYLTWNKPSFDGGSPVTGYIIEMSNPESPENFYKVSMTKSIKYIVTSLQEGREYRIRIRAVNKIGESEATDLPEPVVPKDVLGK